MSIAAEGVRFRLFPDWAENPLGAETIALNLPVGLVGPGPSDPWMYVVDALGKPPYEPPGSTPPWRGPRFGPALPGASGHFDHIAFEDPTFAAAHLYGASRFALDVWEKYLGRKLRWRSASLYPRLELVPHVDWDNAQSGAGFLETGARRNREGELQAFCLNFDVVAHEIGHTILFAEIGLPAAQRLTSEFLAFHESMADLAALVAMMHFDGVVGSALASTHGNLYALNMLNRFGILSKTEQIRVCDNTVKMPEVAGLRIGPDGEWIDPTGGRRNAHDLAAPLTGGLFDLFVELYQSGLVARGLIDEESDARNWSRGETTAALAALSARFGESFAAAAPLFRAALLDARDIFGATLALMFERLDPDDLSYERVAALFLACLAETNPHSDIAALADNFTWREIGVSLAPERRASPGRANPPYAARNAGAQAAKARAQEGSLSAGAVHRLINHDHRAHRR